MGFIPFNGISVILVIGCAFACYGVYKYSEPFELEKFFIELIYGK